MTECELQGRVESLAQAKAGVVFSVGEQKEHKFGKAKDESTFFFFFKVVLIFFGEMVREGEKH